MFVEDRMSNLTSASNEASLSSSSNRNEVGTMYPPLQSFASVHNQTQTNKKKKSLPGNPDPEAEVVAMSPKSLMATNRFLCEICNKGFQRDQNLQLHRRGHNLPWKLKQRSKTEVIRKKVYVCPESSCVHHEPSRALGDLTGIKKHYSRKHGEKKWKCDKCSKRYAVQSDWKAHSKICGTREYRCDCGTLFSRRDSFITHRAFCDALAEESARSSSTSFIPPNHVPLRLPISNFSLKTEPESLLQHPQLNSNAITHSPHQNHPLPSWLDHHQTQNPNPNDTKSNIHIPSPPPPHMSATALLQKAARMGVTWSNPAASTNTSISMSQQQQRSIPSGTHQHSHMCAPTALTTHHASGQRNLSSSNNDHQGMFELSGEYANVNTGCMDQMGEATTTAMLMHAHSQMLYTNSLTSTITFGEAYNGMLSSTKGDHATGFQDATFPQASASTQVLLNPSKEGGGSDELTRDFLGIRGFQDPNSDHHFLNVAGLGHFNTSAAYHQQQQQNTNQNQMTWHG